MTKVLALAAALFALVSSNNIFSDFASSICQQRYQLNGDVVCQPDGEFAARQCSKTTGMCYCATEAGELIAGTSFKKDKNYVCRNVQYDIEYKHPQRNAGFDVENILSAENQLTKKLTTADRRNAMWEMRGVAISRHRTEKGFNVLESVLVGYNTRLGVDDVVRKARNVLGVGENAAGRLTVRQIYSSVHEGECPVERSPCNEDLRECYSDSECDDSELCCTTQCGDRCLAMDTEPTLPFTYTSSYTPEEASTEQGPVSSTDGDWFRTTGDGDQATGSEAMTSQDWSTTDSLEFTQDLSETQDLVTEPFTTEKLFEESSGTPEMEFPSTEPDSTWTPDSYTENTADTTEPLDLSQQSTELQTTFVNSLGSKETSPMNSETTPSIDMEESSTMESGGEYSSTESGDEYSSTESGDDYSSTESGDDYSSTESGDDYSSTESGDEYSSTESGVEYSSTESLVEGSSSKETKSTTDVTGFLASSSTEQSETDPLSFFTSPEGSDSITYFTEQLTDSTEDGSESPTLDFRISDTEGITEALFTSSQMRSLCEQEADQAISEGREGPLCLDNGSYSPQQCDTSRDICWCVDEKGLELSGSRRYGSADCDNYRETTTPMTTTEPMGDCWRAYQRAVKEQAYNRGVMVPTCQDNGLYAKSQCHGTFCWCVDEMTGIMVDGTRKPGPIDCELFTDGVCPEFARDHDSVCIDKCDSDEVCFGSSKCCQTHCGRDCVIPQLPDHLKEGQCSAPQSMNTIFEKCAVECKNDQDCDDTAKCCFNGCGYSCSAPVYDTNIYCKKVDSLYKGSIDDPRDQYTEGDTLKVSCDYGYELQGQEEIRCLASGEWEHDLPVCKRISCGVPGSGQFMVVRGSDYFVGGVVTYHCYSGYELRGAATATCLVSGRWDAKPPSCHRVKCPEMNELQYGRVYGRLMTYGNRIGFRCDYGYTLVGSEQRLCLSDGTWSGTDPSCVRGYYSRSRRHKFQPDDELVGNGKCQYGVIDTIDYNGDCVENVLTISCQCGEPDSVEQKVKVLCQRGENEFIERNVKIGMDCSCCDSD